MEAFYFERGTPVPATLYLWNVTLLVYLRDLYGNDLLASTDLSLSIKQESCSLMAVPAGPRST